MKKKLVIGMIGKAGSGKDTVGDYLVKNYNFKKIALADPIKTLIKTTFMLDDHTVYDRVAREQPLEDFPEWSVRKLLQFIGTELFRNQFDNDIWVKLLLKQIKCQNYDRIVVTDIRFPNESECLRNGKEIDFYTIKTTRKNCIGKNVGLKNHESEKHNLDADFVLRNNETIESLYKRVDKLMKKILQK